MPYSRHIVLISYAAAEGERRGKEAEIIALKASKKKLEGIQVSLNSSHTSLVAISTGIAGFAKIWTVRDHISFPRHSNNTLKSLIQSVGHQLHSSLAHALTFTIQIASEAKVLLAHIKTNLDEKAISVEFLFYFWSFAFWDSSNFRLSTLGWPRAPLATPPSPQRFAYTLGSSRMSPKLPTNEPSHRTLQWVTILNCSYDVPSVKLLRSALYNYIVSLPCCPVSFHVSFTKSACPEL